MTTFTRVLWKEFRSQLHVWSALVIGILLLQLLIASVTIAYETRLHDDAVEVMLVVVLVVGVCHCAASCAILFAGEREDETSFLLRTFPIPPSSLLGGKIAYVLLSGLALLAVGTATALVIGAVGGAGPAPYLPAHSVIARSLIGAAAWGILFSLLLDRVINALGLAFIAEFAAVAITGNLFSSGAGEAYWAIVLTVLGVDAWLAWRWTSGWNFSLSDTFSNRASGRTKVSSFWLGLLRRLASAGMPASRATGALLWREIRSVVPFVLGFSLLGFLTVVVGMRWEAGIAFNGLFFSILPIACGFMAGGTDQGRQTFRFLTDRGVSPYRIWTIKIVTWALTGVALTLLFVGIDALANGGVPDRYGRRTVSILAEIRQNIHPPGHHQLPWEFAGAESRLLQDNFIASSWMLLFVVGQLAAFWHRKPVVGASVGFGLSILAIAWQFTLVGGDIPLWLCSWPLIVAGLLATWVMSPQWLLEDRSWSAFRRRAAWVVLPVLCVLLAARTQRIESVAVARPALISWQEGKLPSSGLMQIDSPVLRELLAMDAQQTLKGTAQAPWGHTPSSAVQTLTEAVKPLRAEGKLEEEWIALRDMLGEVREHSRAVDNWMEWSQCVSLTQTVLLQVRDWGADPRQTEKLLTRAVADIRQQDQVLTPIPMLRNRYIRWRKFLDGQDISDSMMNQYQLTRTLTALGIASGEIERAARLLETITVGEMESAQDQMLTLDKNAINDPSLEDEQRIRKMRHDARTGQDPSPPDLYRKILTTILLPPELRGGGLATSFPVQSQLYISLPYGRFLLTTFFPQQAPFYLASVRGTEISLRLQKHFLQHGTFPDSLDALAADGDGPVPSDPFSRRDFLYHPTGFPQRLELKGSTSTLNGSDARIVVPARQPVLLGVGPGDARILHEHTPDAHFEAVPRHTPIRTGFLLGDMFSDLNEKRVRFLILD